MKTEVEITNTLARFRDKLDRWRRLAFTIIPLALGFAWFSLSPQTRADCTDGCFASDNTALGDHAGADPEASNNTAVGSFCMPLLTVPPGSFNTAVGSLSFYNAENGNDNTVIGYGAMGTGNGGIVGRSADFNTAAGAYALFYDSVGMQNTAAGAYALYSNSLGDNNTATGFKAMYGDPTNPFSGSNNTADGYQALYSNAGNVYGDTGNDNVAIGRGALYSNTASDNTADGSQALNKNTTGTNNVAVGRYAMFNNTVGSDDIAVGRGALYNNTTASNNVAIGYQALNKNTIGTANTATGTQALQQANTGFDNTANGYQALNKDTSGAGNTAIGYRALYSNITNSNNTAAGYFSLYNSTGQADTAYGQSTLYNNTTGATNTALGSAALYENTTGSNNTAVGAGAGFSLTTGGYNIDIGNPGVVAEANTTRLGTVGQQTNTYIAGIYGVTVPGGIGVIVDSNGHMGTSTSSARFKENVRPMDNASEAILLLQPVTFRYKKELDPRAIPQFGLVAEQVEKVDPDLVACDEQGKAYSVRYEAVNAMLLNEFLKEHSTVQEQKVTITQLQSAMAQQRKDFEATATQQRKDFQATAAQQEKEIKALVAGLQKVSNQLELTKPVARVVANNQ